ncbi:hypothetical protein B0H14DRAFT_3529054 [Mycena olivaceomarginata]|nr:hypothetical protein B0H14DRAFT_3529054 [Mycena olivaceomarginata]
MSDVELTDVADPGCFRLLDLPPEILAYIFTFLPNAALHTARQSCHFLSAFITSSVELQYQMAVEVAQVTDNPTSPIPISERLARLRAREEAFGEVNATWKVSVSVPFPASGLYELSGGMFWLGEVNRKALRYIELPSRPAEEGAPPMEWGRIALPSKESVIIDFGLGIEEHDLIAMVTFTPSVDQYEGLVKLEFFTVSAPHVAHPEAQGPITVENTRGAGKPNVTIEIVGEHLLFILVYAFSPGRARGLDSVYLFEWKTGKLKWKNTAESGTYYGGVFLSPEVIMLPNTIAARLELWSTVPEQKAPILMLHLPRLVPGRSIRTITARGEPNPQGTYRKPRRMPFHSSVEDSIVLWILPSRGPRCTCTPSCSSSTAARCSRSSPRTRPATRAATRTGAPTSAAGSTPAGWSPSWFIMLDFNPAKARAHEVLQPEDDPFCGLWDLGGARGVAAAVPFCAERGGVRAVPWGESG